MKGEPTHLRIPQTLGANESYQTKIAATPEEIRQVQKLRFEVFNLELDEGLDRSYMEGLDRDEYDPQFKHLIIVYKPNNRVIATYRIQNYAMAKAGLGFYSSGIFDLGIFSEVIQKNMLEIGRACIARDHRKAGVFFLLWKGLAEVLYANKLRYFFGCNSVASQNPQDANGIIRLLKTMQVYHRDFYALAKPGYKCPYKNKETDITKVSLPVLFNIYLRFRCRICSEPALDRDFKTIIFLMIYDYQKVSDKYHKMFLGNKVRIKV